MFVWLSARRQLSSKSLQIPNLAQKLILAVARAAMFWTTGTPSHSHKMPNSVFGIKKTIRRPNKFWSITSVGLSNISDECKSHSFCQQTTLNNYVYGLAWVVVENSTSRADYIFRRVMARSFNVRNTVELNAFLDVWLRKWMVSLHT